MRVYSVGAALLMLLGSAGRLPAGCPDDSDTAGAVGSARYRTIFECCDGAQTHRTFLRCAKAVVGTLVHEGNLPRGCRRQSLSCARQSTCGRPEAVTCCITRAGATKCRVKRNAAHCRAPRGGKTCVDPFIPSCCAEFYPCEGGTCGTSCGDSAPQCGGRCRNYLEEVCLSDCTMRGRCECFPFGAETCSSCSYPDCAGFCGLGRSYCQPFRTVDPASGTEQVRCGCTPANAPACAGSGSVCSLGICGPVQVCTTFVDTGECRCTPLQP
jgi:hypothetical protein